MFKGRRPKTEFDDDQQAWASKAIEAVIHSKCGCPAHSFPYYHKSDEHAIWKL